MAMPKALFLNLWVFLIIRASDILNFKLKAMIMSNETLKKLAGIFQEEFSRRSDGTINVHKLGGEVWYE